MGLPYDCEPSDATHLTLVFLFTSQVVGKPFMFEIILRSGVPPHIGQSFVPGSEASTLFTGKRFADKQRAAQAMTTTIRAARFTRRTSDRLFRIRHHLYIINKY